jgi:hypothetical protein
MNDSFRDRLLRLEQVTPALKEQYDKEIKAMLEKRITGIRRWVWLGCALMGVVFAVLFGTLAVIAPAEFPLTGRIGFAAGALFGIAWAVLGLRVFQRGSIDLKVHSGAAAGMAWGLPVILLTLFIVSAPDTIVGLRMIVTGLAFLVMGLGFLLRHVIEQSELKTREKLLDLEYRLAEFVETTKSGKTQA